MRMDLQVRVRMRIRAVRKLEERRAMSENGVDGGRPHLAYDVDAWIPPRILLRVQMFDRAGELPGCVDQNLDSHLLPGLERLVHPFGNVDRVPIEVDDQDDAFPVAESDEHAEITDGSNDDVDDRTFVKIHCGDCRTAATSSTN